MLPDALKADRFGTLDDIIFLMREALSPTHPRSAHDLASFCENKSAVFASSLEPALALLAYLSMVHVDAASRYVRALDLKDEEDAGAKIATGIFSKMASDGTLSAFIEPESIEFDPVEDVVCVRSNHIPLDYSGLKNLLISAGFFRQHPLAQNLLVIVPARKEIFDDIVVPSIKSERFGSIDARHLSLAALMRIQELNEIHGQEAEEFVLAYEKKRLAASKLAHRIRRISDMQCDAGYDIVSLDNTDSETIDRFIEVKSYSAEVSFFWSQNEVSVAGVKNEAYFLYLVDRQKMARIGYEPLIIKNPHGSVFLDEKTWHRDATSWRFFQA